MVHMLPTPWGPYLGLWHQRVGVIQIESPLEPKDLFLKQDLVIGSWGTAQAGGTCGGDTPECSLAQAVWLLPLGVVGRKRGKPGSRAHTWGV